MTAMTDAQATARLNATLNAIWRSGDRDEQSIKHICHSLAAIISGKTWEDGIDYKRPWDSFDPLDPILERNLNKKLAERWSKVQAMRDELGADRFRLIVERTDFGEPWGYVEHYVEMYYIPGGRWYRLND